MPTRWRLRMTKASAGWSISAAAARTSAHYDGWAHLLDIDPAGGPDIVCDARVLKMLRPAQPRRRLLRAQPRALPARRAARPGWIPTLLKTRVAEILVAAQIMRLRGQRPRH
jgi:hypothetical protein